MYFGEAQSSHALFAVIAGFWDRSARFIYSLLLLCGLVCSLLHAQSAVTTGSIRGVLTDQSGAVLPSASVEVEQEATGTKSTRISNAQGEFVFPSLAIGQ